MSKTPPPPPPTSPRGAPHAAPVAAVISLDAARRGRQQAGRRARGILYWTTAGVTAANAVTSATFAVLAVLASRGHSEAAMHACARSLPLAVAALVHVVFYVPASLCTLTLVMGFVQLLDFVVGIIGRDPMQIGPPLLFSVLTMACAIPMLMNQITGPQESRP